MPSGVDSLARKRMLSPEFFTSRTMNELPIQTMLTFAGLWCYVDDTGRGEDDTVMVKAAIWPRRKAIKEAKVEADLALLDQRFLVCRYSVGGVDLLHVVNWAEHQKISHPAKSKLAPCRHHEPAAWEFFRTDDDPALDKFRRGSGGTPEGVGSDSNADQLSVGEKNLSGSDPVCLHGFSTDDACPMCQRRASA